MESERIFIAGGTGFVGNALRAALGDRPLRLLVRDIAKSAPLQSPNVELVEGDVTEPLSIEGATRGCDVVINLVAIIKEHGKATFDNVIRQGTVNLLMEAQTTKPRRFVQMSALGAQQWQVARSNTERLEQASSRKIDLHHKTSLVPGVRKRKVRDLTSATSNSFVSLPDALNCL